jgi:hypothetical protein
MPAALYAVFHCADQRNGAQYYESIDMPASERNAPSSARESRPCRLAESSSAETLTLRPFTATR